MDPFVILPSLPFSGFGYIVVDNGLTHRIAKLFGLYRLQEIKQLGYLHYPIIQSGAPGVLVREFPHNRFVHSLDVRAVAKLILANNNRSEVEHTLCDIAALTHDTLTPAGGDSIKWIDQKVFDEDLHYPQLMSRIDWSQLPEAPQNAAELLPKIILNRGVLGQVLDIADKIAYVGRDLCAFYIHGPKLEDLKPLRELLEKESQPCSLWEDARIEKDQLYFCNKEKLINFLMVRATLFGKLYQNPSSRFWEMFVKTFVEKRLYGTGKLTRDTLLQINDHHLHELISQEIGADLMGMFVGMNNERLETFQTVESAEARKCELVSQGRVVAMLEKAFTAKAGVHFKVRTPRGLKPLSEADPQNALLIRQAMDPGYKFGLHYLDTHRSKLPKALRSWQKW